MCFGGSNTSTTVQAAEIPKYLQDFSKENLAITRDITARPYEPYTAPRLAGFNADSQAGFDQVRNNQGIWAPNFNAANQTASSVAGRETPSYLNADMSAYMDPYIQNVIQNAMSESNRQADIQKNQNRATMDAQGAYGGGRHGVVESEQQRNQMDLQNQMLAQLFSGAFTNAQGMYNQDVNNQMQSDELRLAGGKHLTDIGTEASRLGYQDAAGLLDIGNSQQALQQQGLDIAYADFLRQFNYPIEQLNLANASLTAQPYATSSNTTATQPGGNSAAQTLGAFGSLAGLAMLRSSKEFKYDDAPADSILEAVEKLPVRAWRYKPEAGMGEDRHVGPYAEDFHELFGLGDGKSIPVVDAVGIGLAATKELALAVHLLEERV